ncbi:hypothetical protein PQS31_07920 [Luteimonas sp BLCC-B24]|uniref:hypothetical protein n=1 Tax=Luteimonas sp. BLCC-B24 TaxID=3025317 RepID=UPI00234CEC33|nr:hypothetical protein [Luteimonas sp. BLCC-B24]MDC7806743.1 hypothetical protein [Luteimonas sp. BLCC-B24]
MQITCPAETARGDDWRRSLPLPGGVELQSAGLDWCDVQVLRVRDPSLRHGVDIVASGHRSIALIKAAAEPVG